jgi:hypothetical protein
LEPDRPELPGRATRALWRGDRLRDLRLLH